jgi:2'-hydroxyisoflavone reductase
VTGIYNATHSGVTWGELLSACRDVAAAQAAITWVPSEFLVEHEVVEWMELPLWIVDPKLAYADRVDVRRALDAGLAFRPIEETVRGALEHAATTEAAGLTAQREAALLAEWHGRE